MELTNPPSAFNGCQALAELNEVSANPQVPQLGCGVREFLLDHTCVGDGDHGGMISGRMASDRIRWAVALVSRTWTWTGMAF